MRTRFLLFSIFLFSIFLMGSSVYASSITLHNTINDLEKVTYKISDTATPIEDYTGEFIITSDYYPGLADYGYCVQEDTSIWSNQAFEIENIIDVSGVYLNVAWLVDTFQPILTEKFQKAALQLAIWDVLDGGDPGLDMDNIVPDTVSDYFFNTIQPYYVTALGDGSINDVIGKGYKIAQLREFDADGGDDVQDIIVRTVPEPASMILFGFGLLGIGAISRKRQLP